MILLLLLIMVLVFGFSSLFIVNQQQVGIVQRLGKFNALAYPGLNFKAPFVDRVVAKLSLKIQQLNFEVETKTKDNVFVKIHISVQFAVLKDKVFDAFYKLSDPAQQMESYIFDVVRAQVPKMNLDEVFEKKDDIANVVKEELDSILEQFGYHILKALITDILPDEKVKSAMNEINAATRLRMAASEKGEASRILTVKSAEAEAQSKQLQGEGIANQRKAIIDGLKDSVNDFQTAVPGATAQDVMSLVMITQYFDTLKEIGTSGNTNTVFLPHSPAGMSDLTVQILSAIKAGQADLTGTSVKKGITGN